MKERANRILFLPRVPGGLRAGGLAVLLFFLGGPPAQGAGVISEAQVKARYLELFARYVEWPGAGRPNDALVVGVLGHDPFGSALEAAFARQIANGRPVVVRRVGSSAEAQACDLVFISKEEARRQAVWLAELADAPVLTVSDHEPALGAGAAILLVREETEGGGRLRFDVNLPAVERAGLRVGSDMMKSARRVLRGDVSGS